jgi:pyruvate, orthophosphate dikinase
MAVFDSWMNERATYYRKINNIPAEWGTAVNVQAMVFGNMGAIQVQVLHLPAMPEPEKIFLTVNILSMLRVKTLLLVSVHLNKLPKKVLFRWAKLANVSEEERAKLNSLPSKKQCLLFTKNF